VRSIPDFVHDENSFAFRLLIYFCIESNFNFFLPYIDRNHPVNLPNIAFPNNLTTPIRTLLISTGFITTLALADNALPPITNVIIGGGMQHCSSFGGTEDLRRCTQPWAEILKRDPALSHLSMDQVLFDPQITIPDFTYRIDASSIAAMNALPTTLLSASTRTYVNAALASNTAEEKPLTALSYADFTERLGLSKLTPAATPLDIAALRHVFVENKAPTTPRKVQARSVVFQKDPYTADIYRALVQAASQKIGGKKPKIGLVTAATENPFNDHDINFHALKSAGADVVWLPADGGIRQAIDRQDCEHTAIYYSAYANTAAVKSHPHMDLIFPDLARIQRDFCVDHAAKFNATLQSLDGIFFSGGNQTRILESFVSKDKQGNYTQISEQLRIIRERHAAGKLVIAGTSAGNAIQTGGMWKGKSVPMISGGDPWRTIVNGFAVGKTLMPDDPSTNLNMRGGSLLSNGGLGVFRFGSLDSHFSNRGREARLVRLVKDGGMDYGFGVDENTALIVRQTDSQGTTNMSVIGEAGVFVVDVRQAKESNAAASENEQRNYRIADVRVHYLTAGDQLTIDRAGALSVQLAHEKTPLTANSNAPQIKQTRIMESGTRAFLKMTQQMGQTGASTALGTTDESKNQNKPIYSALLSRQADTQFRSDTQGRVSYTNLVLTLQPAL
jgi:cyanophycinase